MKTLHHLCAGAAEGLLRALQPEIEAVRGLQLQGRFGAVGALEDALRSGAPCDLLVSTQARVDALLAEGRLLAGSVAPLGRVRTGVAVRAGEPLPEVGTPGALAAALRAAPAIHFPDPLRATAGIHFARVLRELGLHDALQPRLRTHPNGATAMRALAALDEPGAIGCTQVSEILHVPGVALAGLLPPRFELATVYTAAVVTGAAEPALAAQLVALLAGPGAQALRARAGFEP